MRQLYFLLIVIGLALNFNAQILVIGNNFLNGSPLAGTKIFVKDGAVITQTLDTRNKNEFQFEVDYGKVYRVYLQNPKCPVMFFEIVANTIPNNKQDFFMSHTCDIPFFNKNDPDVDTTVFVEPFYRIVFNGKKSMDEDAEYTRAFEKRIIKKTAKIEEPAKTVNGDQVAMLAGKIYFNASSKLAAKNKTISAINSSGAVVKSTKTNRYGAFVFTGVYPNEIVKIRMENLDMTKESASLYNSKSGTLLIANPKNDYEWDLNKKDLANLTDNNYSTNIGGKLVSTSSKEKKFYANKNIYLSNKYSTVIKQTKTSTLGTFVFEDIKPDNSYFIGVDKADLIAGQKIDLLSKEDHYIATLDSVNGDKKSMRLTSNYNKVFNDVSIGEEEMKMDIKASIYGDNVNQPIGKLKIVLLNDNYQIIDSAVTDNYGTFKFKYLPFLKRFYLSAENNDNVMDMYKNILIYSSDNNLIKIMTHQKGTKFKYNPVSAELSSLRDIELEDPWLELIDKQLPEMASRHASDVVSKSIIENILFETNKHDITDQAKEILDKIILVLNTNKQLKIEIGAHTDSKGSDAQNMKLSEMRAKTVKDYISSSGIDVKRISARGYGESKLLNNCGDNQPCSELEHARNRRIEFNIQGE